MHIDENTAAGAGDEPGTHRLAGRTVSRAGFGTRQLSRPGHPQPVDRDTGVGLLRRAVELGVNHVDTADYYGAGVANDLIRAALSPYPADLAIVSKVGVQFDNREGLAPAQLPEQLRAGVDENLRRLGTEQLAAVYLRRVDTGPRLLATGHQQVDLEDQLAELVALRDEGKIGGIGLSNVNVDQLRRALPAGIACVQNFHNVLERDGEPVLDECRRQEVPWVPFFPLGSPSVDPTIINHPTVRAVAQDVGARPAQVALAWLLAQDSSTLLVPGTLNPGHLAENVAALRIDLGASALHTLDAVAPPARSTPPTASE